MGLFDKIFGQTQKQRQSGVTNQTSSTTLPGISPEGQAVLNQLRQFGTSQSSLLNQLINEANGFQGQNAYTPISALTPEDMAVLNNAYGAAREGLGFDASQLASQVSGASGIRRTSSPVAATVAGYMLPQYAALRSQQAQQQLGLGLENRNFGENQRRYNQQWRLGLTNTQPTALTNLGNYYTALQFAQPTQRVSGTFNNQTTNVSTPSPFQIGMGLGSMIMPLFTGGMGMAGGAAGSSMELAGANMNAGPAGLPSKEQGLTLERAVRGSTDARLFGPGF